MKSRLVLAPLLIALLAGSIAFAAGDIFFEEGLREYNRQDYKAAALQFEKSLKGKKPSSEAYYYAALTQHQLGNIEKARTYYKLVIEKYPTSQAAALAKTAFISVDKPQSQPGEGEDALTVARPADLDSLPKETWVEFARMGNHVIIDAEMNRHPIKMVFDTGADACLFSISQLNQLGVHIPDRPPDTQGMGVGNAVSTPIWIVPVNLKVGKIERRNFPVCATNSNEMMPLLGQNFFKDFQYTIDDSSKAILFKRSQKDIEKTALGQGGAVTVSTQGHYVYSVPYRTMGREVIVVAKVNGKDCSMIFDTGATTCFFTTKQFADLGLVVSPNAPSQAIQGIAGSTTGKICVIDHVKLGPIDAQDVVTAVSDKANLPMPLLGQNFFKEWKYTIDTNHKVINFEKK